MSEYSRRTVVRGAAWTVPVIAVAAQAPAFAASKRCQPFSQCKDPGDGSNTKDYEIFTNCGGADITVTTVTVDGEPAIKQPDGGFKVFNFKDSRAFRDVRICFTDRTCEDYTVAFSPCK